MHTLHRENRLGKSLLFLALFLAILLIAAGVGAQTTIDNPLGNNKSFGDLVKAITNAVQKIAILIAPVAYVFVGIKFLLASGNDKKLTEVKKMFWWVTIGAAVAIGASALADAIVNFAKTI